MNLSNDFLEITFDDGVHTKLAIQNILKEFSNINDVKYISKIKWDSSLKDFNNFEFKDNFFEEEEMYKALISFYQYGFVIFKKVPTKNNFIVNFANSIGSIRRTNFGEFFNVKSKFFSNYLMIWKLFFYFFSDKFFKSFISTSNWIISSALKFIRYFEWFI